MAPRKPRELKLLGYNLLVRRVKEIRDADADYTPSHDEIRIGSNMSPEQRLSRLLHELIHAMITKQSLTKYFVGRTREAKEKNEEMFVELMEPALMSLLKDNGIDLGPFEDVI